MKKITFTNEFTKDTVWKKCSQLFICKSKCRWFVESNHNLSIGITAGFTIFPSFVALVTKKTHVEFTKYVHRHTPAMASSRQPQTTNKRTMAVASGFDTTISYYFLAESLIWDWEIHCEHLLRAPIELLLHRRHGVAVFCWGLFKLA